MLPRPTTFLVQTNFTQPEASASIAHNAVRRILLITSERGCLEGDLIRRLFEGANEQTNLSRRPYAVELVCFDGSDFAGDWDDFRNAASLACRDDFDTVVIADNTATPASGPNRGYLEWLSERCTRARRIVALARGVLHLSALQLFKGQPVVIHWSFQDEMQSQHPGVSTRSDILFAQNGNLYTCAGATASIDLGLHLVEQDLGFTAASRLAQHLLLPLRRNSACSQISFSLRAQTSPVLTFSDLLASLPTELASDLTVKALARRVAMSPRNFSRRFREQLKMTPARYVQELRFEAAKRELLRRGQTISGTVASCGFKDYEALRRLFQRRLGVSPKAFRKMAGSLGTFQKHEPTSVASLSQSIDATTGAAEISDLPLGRPSGANEAVLVASVSG